MAAKPIAAKLRVRLMIGASVGALLAPVPAYGQDTGQPSTQGVEQSTPAEAGTANQRQQLQSPPPDATVGTNGGNISNTEGQRAIVVTGSRIKQPEFTSADPVARIDPEIANRAGKQSLAETIQTSPIAAGSTQVTSALSSNFVTNGGPGAETIDLRGLGPNRTLVLLNGRRAGPAGTRGGVSSFDLNVLPQAILKQVDILKTGASSIYGSDAVAGVVNFITKTDFNGLELDARGNVPTRGAGQQYSVSVLAGKTFSRGHVMIAAEYFRQNELARGDRSYLNCPEAYIFKQGTNQRADLIDPRTGKYHCEDLPVGQVWTYDYEYNYLGGRGNLNLADGRYVGPVTLMQYMGNNNFGLPPI